MMSGGKGGQDCKRTKLMTKKSKKYEAPQMSVIKMETSPLLAGSGNMSGEDGNWKNDGEY